MLPGTNLTARCGRGWKRLCKRGLRRTALRNRQSTNSIAVACCMFSMRNSHAVMTKLSLTVPASCEMRQPGGQYRQQQNADPEEMFLRAGVLCLFVRNLQPCQRKINTHLNQFVARPASLFGYLIQRFNHIVWQPGGHNGSLSKCWLTRMYTITLYWIVQL